MQQPPQSQPAQTPQPGYYWPQQPQPKRKRNPVVWWVNGGIACVVLVVVIVIGDVLTGHSFPWVGTSCSLPSLTGSNTTHPILANEYKGVFKFSAGADTVPMQLNSINENQQGAICGTLVIGTLANNSHPFTGTVRADDSITFTATLASMTVPTTFDGVVDVNGSILRAGSILGASKTLDGSFMGTWLISPG